MYEGKKSDTLPFLKTCCQWVEIFWTFPVHL